MKRLRLEALSMLGDLCLTGKLLMGVLYTHVFQLRPEHRCESQPSILLCPTGLVLHVLGFVCESFN